MLKKLCRIGISLMIILNSCVFAVPPVSAEDATDCAFEIGTNYVSLKVGETFNPNLTNTTGKEVTWTSNAQDVAEVDDLGNITAKKAGVAKITAATENNDNLKTCDVNVYSDALVLNSSYKRIAIGESFRLKGIIKSESPSVAELTLTSNDKQGVVSINGDTVTAAKAGTTVVTAKASSGETAICAIEVYDPQLYFENNFFEISGTGSDDTAKGLKGQAQLELKGTLANSEDVKYTCYDSKWMKEWKGNVAVKDMYTFDRTNMTVTAWGGASGMVEVVASRGGATATATIMVGGCDYGNNETGYVAGNELLNQTETSSALPANYADHYLWKFGYASYGQTNYKLMEDKSQQSLYGKKLNDKNDWSSDGAFHLTSSKNSELEWFPGRNGPEGTKRDTMLVFRAPKSGRIKVSANPECWNAETKKSERTVKLRGKSEMTFKVKYKGEDTYKYEFINSTSNSKLEAQFITNFGTKTIDVQKGEEIVFVLSYGIASTTDFWNVSGLSSGNGSMFKITYDNITKEPVNNTLDITLVPGEEYTLREGSIAVSCEANDDVAAVDGAKITANAVGSAKAVMVGADGKEKTVNITVKNIKKETTSEGANIVKVGKYAGGHIYAAEFDGEKLKNVTVTPTKDSEVVNVTIPSSGAKVFLWDSDMKPICAVVEQ